MDPIQQRLQAVYQKKSESDIDKKLKSASTTVLDQRISFHDASKVPSCPNVSFKGKYLFMKSLTTTPTATPSKKHTCKKSSTKMWKVNKSYARKQKIKMIKKKYRAIQRRQLMSTVLDMSISKPSKVKRRKGVKTGKKGIMRSKRKTASKLFKIPSKMKLYAAVRRKYFRRWPHLAAKFAQSLSKDRTVSSTSCKCRSTRRPTKKTAGKENASLDQSSVNYEIGTRRKYKAYIYQQLRAASFGKSSSKLKDTSAVNEKTVETPPAGVETPVCENSKNGEKFKEESEMEEVIRKIDVDEKAKEMAEESEMEELIGELDVDKKDEDIAEAFEMEEEIRKLDVDEKDTDITKEFEMEEVIGKLDVDEMAREMAEEFDMEELLGKIDVDEKDEEMAEEFEMEEVIREFDVDEMAREMAEEFEMEELLGKINADEKDEEMAEELEMEELLEKIDVDEMAEEMEDELEIEEVMKLLDMDEKPKEMAEDFEMEEVKGKNDVDEKAKEMAEELEMEELLEKIDVDEKAEEMEDEFEMEEVIKLLDVDEKPKEMAEEFEMEEVKGKNDVDEKNEEMTKEFEIGEVIEKLDRDENVKMTKEDADGIYATSFAQTQEARNNNSAHTTQKLSSAPNEIRKPQKYETGKILNAQRSKSPVPREASVKGYSEESAAKTVPAELSSTENNSELEAVIEKPETSPSPGTSQTSDIDSRENAPSQNQENEVKTECENSGLYPPRGKSQFQSTAPDHPRSSSSRRKVINFRSMFLESRQAACTSDRTKPEDKICKKRPAEFKAKERPKKPKLTPSFVAMSDGSESEPEIIRKHGTSTRPRAESSKNEMWQRVIGKEKKKKKKKHKKPKLTPSFVDSDGSESESEIIKKYGTSSRPKTEILSQEMPKEKTKKRQKKPKLTPSFVDVSDESEFESEVIKKRGTSTRPRVESLKNEKSKEKEDKDEDKEEEENFDEDLRLVNFKEYLPNKFKYCAFYPSEQDVQEMINMLHEAFNTGDEGDGLPRPEQVLFPENRLDYTWKFPDGGCGLVNRGNTCFINAALQCLTYTPPLVNFLMSGQHAHECKMMNKEQCILCGFTRYLHQSLKSLKNNMVPVWFLNNLYSFAKHFSLGRQEDSHEFLRLSLEQMQKVCLVGHTQLDRYSKETTVVNQIFGGFLRSQVVCLKCKAKSNTYDPVLDISLDIRTCNTLEKAFEIFVSPEKLDIENAYKCGRCNQKVEAMKRFTIHKPQNVMTIQLKRFQASHDDRFGHGSFRGVKINKAIKFPPRLNIRGYMSNRNGPPEIYSLYALLFHEGHTANSGHYTSTVKSGNKWFHISDGTKLRTSLHTVNLQDVYVLFYMREDKQIDILKNPALKSDDKDKSKDGRETVSFTSLPSASGLQKPQIPPRPCMSATHGIPKPSPVPQKSPVQQKSPVPQKFLGPVKPKMIHTPEFHKPSKTATSSAGTPSNDIGTPFVKAENRSTPQKPDTMRAPLAADRNKVSFGIKPKGNPSHSSDVNTNAQTEPAPALSKPRIVMQIKHGKVMTIEASPDGQRKILSDDEEVMAKTSRKESHKKYSKKSVLVPYGNESSSDSDAGIKVNDRPKVKKKERKEDVVFDTSLNATTSVPGNIHLMKTVSNHTDITEPSKPTSSVQKEKAAKSENVLNDCDDNLNASHAQIKHSDSDSHKAKPVAEDKHDNDKHHTVHTAGKKRKLIEGAKTDVMHGEFHVVSDKIPLLSSVDTESDQRDKDLDEYTLMKKAKKHKKHKKDKHRNKEHKYEELVNESSHQSEHHVKKHKKKKRKHRDYSQEDEEHSHKKRKHRESSEERSRKHHHHHHSESVEERHHKRQRQESESSSSVEFEWVERTVDTPVRLSKSTSW